MYRLISSLTVVLLFCCSTIASQEASDEPGLRWESAQAAFTAMGQLQGVWAGVGEGKWGTSSAEKTFALVLGGKAICRSSRSVYPVQERNPEGEVHKAHALIYLAKGDSELRLTEYDNEGFVVRYLMDQASSQAGKSWVFELESGENLPPDLRARLTIRSPGTNSYVEDFELDFSGKGYVAYLTNRLTRISSSPADQACIVQ